MEWYNVGKIVNTHGIRGEVRVMATTDFPDERFAVGSELAIFMPKSKTPVMVKVVNHRKHKNFNLLTFEGYPNINDVEKFRDGIVKVSERDLTELEENEFYYHEIIGCRVVTETGEEIGTVTEIIETGANDVWTVTPEEGKPHYIPYIEQVVKEIDVDDKLVKIELMDGLLS
ncbi:ribosome maturation factor RimM [Sporosarcina cascadiensis]|uniref:ribosome maturation factor RimM n=1 Tax=Sporosarcina cascadiensis TaxID=2660747 RepID=UPI00129AD1A4|nr:ribosome maturation factor RimM [Sporosarcina cascadiensis]